METVIIILKSAAILTLFYVLYLAVLRQDTFFSANRHYLLAGIIASLVIPFIEFTKTIYKELPVLSDLPISTYDFSPEITQLLPAETTTPINWLHIGLVIYGVGVLVMLSRLMIQLFSLQKFLSKYPATTSGTFTFVRVDDDIAPFSFFKQICYNPSLHSQEELEMIIAHEQIHALQHHTIDVLLTQVVLALQWFNPLAWFYKKSLEQNLEFIADHAAIEKAASATAYQHTLVKVSSTARRPALTNQFYHSLIKKRILMLNKENSKKHRVWKLGLILPLLAVFMYSFNVKEVVEYREVARVEAHTAFAKSLASATTPATGKSLILKASHTDAQIEVIRAQLEQTAENLKIRFTKRKRNASGALTRILVETKYPSQLRFYENVTFGKADDKTIPEMIFQIVNGNDLQFSNLSQKMVFRTSLDGVKAELFPKKEETVMPTLGEDPLYIINGKQVASQDVKSKTFELDGEVQVLGQKEAVQKYGTAAKDGALEFKGTTVIQEQTPAVTPTLSQEPAATTTAKDIRFKIDKNTTDAQLKTLKEELSRDHNIDLSYTIRRNEAKEITTIQISYTGEGNNGNYSISGDQPIDEFYFLLEEGKTRFWSEKSEARMQDRKSKFEERRSELEAARAERKEAMGERKEALEKAHNVRKEAMKERSEAMREKMKERREEMKERGEEIRERAEEMKERGEEMRERGEEIRERAEEIRERAEEMKERMNAQKEERSKIRLNLGSGVNPLYIINGIRQDKDAISELNPDQIDHINVVKGEKAIAKYGKDGENGVIEIQLKGFASFTQATTLKTMEINAATTDAQIAAISKKLEADGATLSLKKVKRNAQGLIIGYRLKFDDGNGSKISTSKQGSNEEIKPIRIRYGAQGKISLQQ